MDPEKPDLVAYTHFLGSEVFGPNSPDSGTSTACPVAAGCLAAIRTAVSQDSVKPDQLRADLENYARVQGGYTTWDPQFGHGIIDPIAVGKQYGVIP